MAANPRGFAFPFRIDPNTGGVAWAAGDDKLRQNLMHLLQTAIGERPMLRDYGGGLNQLVHDPNNDALRALIQHQVTKAIVSWEPTIQVQALNIVQQDGDLLLELRYIVRRTRETQSVSVPLDLG